jgi:hypothetical protein
MRRGLAIVAGVLLGASACMAANYYRQMLMLPRAAVGAAPSVNRWEILMHFDEANGATNYTDSGSNSFYAGRVNTGVYTTNSPAKFGSALRLSVATGDRCFIGGNGGTSGLVPPGTNDWTVEMWVYLDAALAATNKPVEITGGASTNQFVYIQKVSANGGAIGYRLSTNGITAATQVNATYDWTSKADQWVHLAVVRYTNATMMYIDGVRMTGATDKNVTGWSFAGNYSTRPTIVGTISSGDPIRGIDEFGIRYYAAWAGTNFTPPTAAYTGYE